MNASNNGNHHNRRRRHPEAERERRRRRNPRRRENRAPFPAHDAGRREEGLGPMGLDNRAPVAPPIAPPLAPPHSPAAMRQDEGWGHGGFGNPAAVAPDLHHGQGWGQGGFENRALAEAPPAPHDDQVAAYYDHYIRAEGQADTIRPLIALAVRQMGRSTLFTISICPMQAANGPAWGDDHVVNSSGDHTLALMTVALAVLKWGIRAQIKMTARRHLPLVPEPPPRQPMAYPAYAPPEGPGAAPPPPPYGEAGPPPYGGYPAPHPPPAGPYQQ